MSHLDGYAPLLTGLPVARYVSVRQVVSQRGVAGGRILWWQGAVVALILVSQMAAPYVGAATMAAMTLWAWRNTRCALQAVTISVLVVFANPALVGDQPLVPLLKWALLFVSLGSILADWKYQPGIRARWSASFALFAVVALFLALAVSGNRSLSLLKLGTFIVGAAVALLGVRDRRYPPDYWLNWFTTVYMVVLVLSAPLQFLPAGRYLNGSNFQGILLQPQSYGVYVAPLTAYVTVALLVEPRKTWFLVAILPWAWYSLFASGCRTAVLAVGLSVVATVASMVVFPRNARSSSQRGTTILTICFVGLLTLAVLATSAGSLAGAIDQFIKKRANEEPGSSRRAQVESLLSTIDENFITGVGFGLSPVGVEQATQREELTGLPIGAYTEQGFLPLAVLAQVGVIGAVPLVLFIATLAFPVAKHGAPALVALFWTTLFVNFGEMIFFATGGLGMYMWLLIACCLAASRADLGRRKPCN